MAAPAMASTRATRSKSALPAQHSHDAQQPPAAPTTRKRARKTPASAPVLGQDENTAAPAAIQAAAVAGPSGTNVIKRRGLRSTKAPDSPLRALPDAPRKTEKRKLAMKKVPVLEPELQVKPEPRQKDIGKGIYFNANPEYKDITMSHADIDNLKTDCDKLKQESNILRSDIQGLTDELAHLRSDIQGLTDELALLKAELAATKEHATAQENENVRANDELHSNCKQTSIVLTEKNTQLADELLETQRLLRKSLRSANYLNSELQAIVRPPQAKVEFRGPDKSAYDLLAKINKQAEERRNPRPNDDQDEPEAIEEPEDDYSMDNVSDESVSEDDVADEPVSENQLPPTESASQPYTPAPATQDSNNITPQSTGWNLRSLFTRFAPSFTAPTPPSAFVVAPATAPPAVLPPMQAQALANTLAPTPSTPTPASETRRRQKNNRRVKNSTNKEPAINTSKNKKPAINTPIAPPNEAKAPRKSGQVGDKRAIVTFVALSVRPEERAKATVWAKEVVKKFASDPSTLGEKRMRFETGIKMGDLKHIPARAPWQPSGTFGLDDDLMENEDEHDAPAWVVMQELLDDMDSPPAKKRKADHDATMDTDITPLNETEVPELSRSIINTNGNSASLADLQPRSSRIPSPFFSDPADHRHDSNIFTRQQAPTNADVHADAAAKAAHEEELNIRWMREQRLKMQEECKLTNAEMYRRVEREHKKQERKAEEEAKKKTDEEAKKKADEETKEKTAESVPLWTQQPPPAPTPAHASLPTPLTASPSVPSIQSEEPVTGLSTPSVDPVERQRAKLMKHTPARPSRLREATIPSPSLRSDAGMFVCEGTSFQVNSIADHDMPNVSPLHLGNDLEHAVLDSIESETFQAANMNAFGGSNAPLFHENK